MGSRCSGSTRYSGELAARAAGNIGLSSSCGESGLLFVAVHGLLMAAASLTGKHGLRGTWAPAVAVSRL